MGHRMLFLLCSFAMLTSLAWSQQFTSAHSSSLGAAREGLESSGAIVTPQKAALAGWTASTSAPILGSPKLADLTGDGVPEVLLATYGITSTYGEGWLYAWTTGGASLPGFPIHLAGPAPATVAVGDVDNNGDPEIVLGTWQNLHVFHHDATTALGWPIPMNVTQAAALADLDGDGDLEIIVPTSTSMKVYHHDGTTFPTAAMTGLNSLTSAALGDLDGDGDLEIVAGSSKASGSATDFVYAWHHDGTPKSGFPVTTAGSVKSPPALADLDGDGVLEIIANCWNKSGTDELYVWDTLGVSKPGWPISVPYIRLSSPSVADLDQDGDLEVVVGGWSTSPFGETVNAYHHTGIAVTGFPVLLINSPSGNVNSTLTIGDIDGDDALEIVIKATNNIFALNANGTVVTGFPVFLDDTSHSGTTSPTPALGDPDGDGKIEIVAASTFNTVTLIDQNGVASPDALPWESFRRDLWNHARYVKPTLATDTHFLPESTGGSVVFSLDAGTANGLRPYLLIGSLSGTTPGWPLPGGQTVVPVNWDAFSFLTASLANTPPLANFLGLLDGQGKSTAQLNSFGPIPAGYIGLKMQFAYFLDFPWNFASNHVQVMISP